MIEINKHRNCIGNIKSPVTSISSQPGIYLLTLCIFFGACSSIPVIQGELPMMENKPFVLSRGDEISVNFQYWPEMNETQTIRPDGKITLPFIDDLLVEGKTPEEVDHTLTELYQASLKDPEITVIVRSFVNNNVYVIGEVESPGIYPFAGQMNLLDAIATAGGYDQSSADICNVIVYRHNQNKRFAKSYNLKSILISPESELVQLEPKDIVLVTRKGILEANDFVEQYIDGVIPDSIAGPATSYFLINSRD